VRKKKREVNVEKTKMMVFNERKRKNEENEWNWEGRKIEQANEFIYLGYTFNERATDKAHIREIVRKANKAVGCVWGIGERKWGGDFRRRMMMFESMMESILMCGAEIWGLKEQEEVEKVEEKYLRGVLGVNRETPGKSVRGIGWEWKPERERQSLKINWIEGKRVQDTNRILERKKNTEKKEREKYVLPKKRVYQCQWGVKRLRAKGRWMNMELSERGKDTDKQETRKNPDTTGSMRGVWQSKFRSTWGERVQKREKWWWNLNVGMRGEKTDIGWKERKECAECVMRRESDDWGMDVAKWEREKGTGSNTEWRHKGDRMDERDMEQERQNTKKGVGDRKKNKERRYCFWNCYFYFR
jgi:hypothetical protein